MASLRAAGLTTDEHKFLGMKSVQSEHVNTFSSFPILKLSAVHNEAVRRCADKPPFQMFPMDGYTLNLVAPDHLITGLCKGVLTITFMQLESDAERGKLEMCLLLSLSEFGFQSQSTLYQNKKKKLVPGLTISSLYCVLMVLPTTLQALGLLDDLPSRQLVLNLHRFVSMAFWWTSADCDGSTAWKFIHGDGMCLYHKSLQLFAINFVKSVQKFHTHFPDLSHHVDRPNVHRLLELAFHTIPLFNHILYVCELVFESAHQPLKFYLSRNHGLGSHVYAVQNILAKDWLIRLWSLWKIYMDESESKDSRYHALLGLGRLLGGDDIDIHDWKSSASSQHFNDLCDHIQYLFKGTVERRLRTWYDDCTMTYSSEAKWVLQKPPYGHQFSSQQSSFFHRSIQTLSTFCLQSPEDFHICLNATLSRGFGSSSKSSHERIQNGDVVQFY